MTRRQHRKRGRMSASSDPMILKAMQRAAVRLPDGSTAYLVYWSPRLAKVVLEDGSWLSTDPDLVEVIE